MMLKISPVTALLQQQDFVTRAAEQQKFSSMLRQLFGRTMDRREADPSTAQYLTRTLVESVAKAETYTVSAEMCDVLCASADALDDSDKIDLSLLPSPHGIVFFDQPFVVKDIRAQTLLAHRLTWSKTHTNTVDSFGRSTYKDGLLLTWWNDTLEPDMVTAKLSREYGTTMSKVAGRWAFVGSDHLPVGARVGSHDVIYGPDAIQRMQEDVARLREGLSRDGTLGRLAATQLRADIEVLERLEANGETSFRSTNLNRIAHALFLMLNQTITDTRTERAPKSIAKSLRRLSLPESVTVVTLRRANHKTPAGAGAPVQWSHKWLVKGHWAWRHCGGNHPLAQPYEGGYRCRLWVNGYVKGPNDKPFKVSRKVYKLAR